MKVLTSDVIDDDDSDSEEEPAIKMKVKVVIEEEEEFEEDDNFVMEAIEDLFMERPCKPMKKTHGWFGFGNKAHLSKLI